ncbi:MAG: carbohydrate ABC transporter permease [Clostridia bacterium]|nr:carbohydrate ABC transporter permease [Clostridia bacterium]
MKDKSVSYRIFLAFDYILLISLTLIFLFPYLNIMAKAFNDSADTALGGLTFYPRSFTFQNIKTILGDKSIVNSAFISVARVVIGTLVAIIVQFLSAYALSVQDLKGRRAVLFFMMIPMFFTGGLIPQFILYSKIKIINTFWVYILPYSFSFYNMVIIRTYIKSLPQSLLEAARLDGAGEFRILVRIIIPLSMPVIATVVLWLMVGYWNDWSTTLYFVTKKRLFTLQYLLMQVINESERVQSLIQQAIEQGLSGNVKIQTTPESLKSAQVIVTTLPILCVYPFLQKYFIKGVMIGSVKE